MVLSRSFAHDIVVHVDANEDLRHLSSQYVRSLAGMVLGHGFQVQSQARLLGRDPRRGFLVKGQASVGRLS